MLKNIAIVISLAAALVGFGSAFGVMGVRISTLQEARAAAAEKNIAQDKEIGSVKESVASIAATLQQLASIQQQILEILLNGKQRPIGGPSCKN